jgi:hypothetical protein
MAFGDRIKRMPRWAFYTIIALVVLIIAIRIALPYVVLKYVNKTLAELPGYWGHVDDVDMNLYRGAYVIEVVNLVQVDSATKKRTPFVHIDRIDVSIHWKALLQGQIVGEIIMLRPRVNFVAATDTTAAVTGEGVDWRKPITDLLPININRFEIKDGSVHFLDPGSSPKVDVFATKMFVIATNLTNSLDVAESLSATVDAKAMVFNEAPFRLRCKLDPFEPKGTFNMDAEMEPLDIKKLNNFLDAYAKIDAEKGTVAVYAEMKAVKGSFEGYVKPLIKDIKILSIKNDKEDGFFRVVWEGLVGLFIKPVENWPHEQVATKIPFTGTLDNPKLRIWPTIGSLLKNAFIHALRPNIENEIGENSFGDKPIEGVSVDVPKEKKDLTRRERRKAEKKADEKADKK